jgi:hypothetical protein
LPNLEVLARSTTGRRADGGLRIPARETVVSEFASRGLQVFSLRATGAVARCRSYSMASFFCAEGLHGDDKTTLDAAALYMHDGAKPIISSLCLAAAPLVQAGLSSTWFFWFF